VSLPTTSAFAGLRGNGEDLPVGLQVRVDQDLCTGDGLCVQLAPAVFEFDVDGLAYVKDADGELRLDQDAQVPVPAGWAPEVLDASRDCPGECIFVTDHDGCAVGGPGAG
jgi:ferredoxin